jgi:hypothetical protein
VAAGAAVAEGVGFAGVAGVVELGEVTAVDEASVLVGSVVLGGMAAGVVRCAAAPPASLDAGDGSDARGAAPVCEPSSSPAASIQTPAAARPRSISSTATIQPHGRRAGIGIETDGSSSGGGFVVGRGDGGL